MFLIFYELLMSFLVTLLAVHYEKIRNFFA